jgi:hypothetical protein
MVVGLALDLFYFGLGGLREKYGFPFVSRVLHGDPGFFAFVANVDFGLRVLVDDPAAIRMYQELIHFLLILG